MKYVDCLAAGAALGLAGLAVAQPTLDGKLDGHYGPIQWIQTQPTQFGDAAPPLPCIPIGLGIQVALDNTNRAGVAGGFPVIAADQTAAGAVPKGFEIKIPLSELGNPAALRVLGFVANNNYSNFSSQVIPGIAADAAAGGYPNTSAVNLQAVSGNQYATVNLTAAAAVPTLDGLLDATFYGTALARQDTTTNYGDAVTPVAGGDSTYKCPGGSEIDALYARKGSDGNLYIFVAGNLESNFNKLVLLFDTGAPNGQNPILNTTYDNGAITDGGPNALAGMTLDTAFSTNYFLSFTVGGAPETMYIDFAKLGTQAQGGATRSLNPAGVAANPFTAQPCPAPPGPDPNTAGGSEIDGLYAAVCGNYLYLFIPGNLQTNGNYLELFLDAGTTQVPVPGSTGQNRIRANNVTVGTAALQRMGPNPDLPVTEPGLRFDTGFNADYYLSFKNTGLPVDVFAIAAVMNTNGAFSDGLGHKLEYGSFVGGPKALNTPLSFDGQVCVDPAFATTGCNPNGLGSFWNPASDIGIAIQGDPNGLSGANTLTPIADVFSSYAPRLISANPYDPFDRGTPASPRVSPSPLPVKQLLQIAIDNSNRSGVTGSDAAAASQVATGVEVRVRIDELGWNGVTPIKVTGWINGGQHDFLSNQVIGGHLDPATPNLGEPRTTDFQSNVPGTGPWYVTIAPGACAPAATGACCFGATSTSNCALMSLAQCGAPGVGGTYKGNATACSPIPCAPVTTGVCCNGAACISNVAAAACTGVHKFFVSSTAVCNVAGNFKTPCCKADYTKTGGITVQDIFDYLAAWFAKDISADINGATPAGGNAAVTVQDIFDFLAAYFAKGCTTP